jgi:general secretion pathway protein D
MRFAAPVLLCLLTAVLAAPGASAQDITVQGEYYVLQFDEAEGEPLVDFIDLAKSILQRPMKYDRQEVGNVFLFVVGHQTVRRDQFYQYFQAILKAHDFIVVNYGPPEASFLSIQKITAGSGSRGSAGGSFFKSQAPVVDVSDLGKFQHDPATLITTSMPLRYIDARSTMSTLTPYFDTSIELVRNVENANNLVITGFGSHVWGAHQLLQLIDVPPYKPTPVIHKRVLLHASVDEISQVITDLLAAARGLRPGQTAATPAQGTTTIFEVEPRIIVEARSNSLLIAGEEDMVKRIEEWIDVLDVEVEPRGNTHVYRLKNTDATEVADVLTRVLEQERLGAQQARAAGQGASTGTGLEVQASAVPDRTSNSVIITAGDRKYSEIVGIVREMDVRRPQVLIECAIVETSKTLTETLNVGLALADLDSGGFASNFGTPTGLDSTGAVDILGELSSQTGTASGLFTGGQFALFSGSDIPIPLIIQAVETDSNNKVLSRPYLMTNDNQEAYISTQEQTSFATAVTTQTSTSQSFDQVEAGIRLTISPTISAGNYLRLRVKIEVSNFGTVPLAGAPPDKTIREVETPVTLPDGHTVILGGLVSEDSTDTLSKTPWFGDLPLIGWMFRATSDNSRGRYLYVFITPHIIDTDFALLDEISEARKRDLARLGGDPSELASNIVMLGTHPDVRQVGPDVAGVFDMPAVAYPSSGDQGALQPQGQVVPQPLPPQPIPQPVPQPQPQPDPLPPPVPGFDDIFGTANDTDG